MCVSLHILYIGTKNDDQSKNQPALPKLYRHMAVEQDIESLKFDNNLFVYSSGVEIWGHIKAILQFQAQLNEHE